MGLQDRYQSHHCSLVLLLVRLWVWTVSQPTGLCNKMQGAGVMLMHFRIHILQEQWIGEVTTDLSLLPALSAPTIPVLVDNSTENGQQGVPCWD